MRKHRFHSKKRRATRWFASDQGYTEAATTAIISTAALTPLNRILAIHQLNILQTPDIVQVNERHTIECIRGQILVYGAEPDTSCIIHLGLLVTELDPAGVPLLFAPDRPQEAGKPWMWLHHAFCLGQVSQGTSFLATETIPVFVKTKRVLRENEALVLACTASPLFQNSISEGASSAQIQPYLRTLVSQPE